jgi:hypothetical protein
MISTSFITGPDHEVQPDEPLPGRAVTAAQPAVIEIARRVGRRAGCAARASARAPGRSNFLIGPRFSTAALDDEVGRAAGRRGFPAALMRAVKPSVGRARGRTDPSRDLALKVCLAMVLPTRALDCARAKTSLISTS